jgi:hypothetical protein
MTVSVVRRPLATAPISPNPSGSILATEPIVDSNLFAVAKASSLPGLRSADPKYSQFRMQCRNSIDNMAAEAQCCYGPGILQFT